jgi:hypothetical protein
MRVSAAGLSQAVCRSLLIITMGLPGAAASSIALPGVSGHRPSRNPYPTLSPEPGRISATASRAERAALRSTRRRACAHWTACTCASHRPGSSVAPCTSTDASAGGGSALTSVTRPPAIRT